MKACWLYIVCLIVVGCQETSGPHQALTTAKAGVTVSYEADVKPIFATYCTACHPSVSGPDWLVYNQAKNFAKNGALMRKLVNEKSMPPPGSAQAAAIPAAARETVATWIQAGAPETTPDAAAGPGAQARNVPEVVRQCIQCHGVVGAEIEARPRVPRLNGQSEEYLVTQLRNFKWRRRLDPTDGMNTLMIGVSDPQIRQMAQYYSRLPGLLPGNSVPKVPDEVQGRFVIGEKLAGDACSSCHYNVDFEHRSTEPLIPLIAGQSENYLINQLLYFRQDERRNPMMHVYTQSLSDFEIECLATYFANIR